MQAHFVKSDGERSLFIYWGRRGAISEFTLELARAAGQRAIFSVARQNELFGEISRSGAPLLPVDTFERGYGAVTKLYRLRRIRRTNFGGNQRTSNQPGRGPDVPRLDPAPR